MFPYAHYKILSFVVGRTAAVVHISRYEDAIFEWVIIGQTSQSLILTVQRLPDMHVYLNH